MQERIGEATAHLITMVAFDDRVELLTHIAYGTYEGEIALVIENAIH